MENDCTYKSDYRSQSLPSCTLEVSYFKRLYEILKTATDEGADIEIAKIRKKPGETDINFESFKRYIKTLFKVSIHIFGSKGEYILTESPSIFDNAGLPDNVTNITFENASKYKAFMQRGEPINRFRIEFDFAEQKVFDFISTPSEATPNKSFIEVSGENGTWVSGTYNKVMESLSGWTNRHGWLHLNNIYDIFLLFAAVPISFGFLYIIDRHLPPQFAELSIFFKVACYIYFFIITMYISRIIFNYARWIFPNIEFIQSTKKRVRYHRYILSTICLSILSTLIWSLIKLIF